MNGYLLDTHALIWYANGNEELSRSARKIINEAGQNRSLYLSAISIWEIAMLQAKKKIILDIPIHQWIREALEQIHIKLAPLTPEISIESCNLPDFHEDPADRMLVATAKIERLTIITRDKRILAYHQKKLVSAIKA